MELFKQVVTDGKETQVCRACVDVKARLVVREMVAEPVDRVREGHLVSSSTATAVCSELVSKADSIALHNGLISKVLTHGTC